jgi:DNA-binding PadR family transcriptional regulator
MPSLRHPELSDFEKSLDNRKLQRYDSCNMVETITTEKVPQPMEMFLIAAISRGGVNTLYGFQQETGLQPGSITKVIVNLQKDGLLDRSDSAKRGRRAMRLTEAGERLLLEEWKLSMNAKREMESILRSATVALLMDDIGAAISFLLQSVFERVRHQGHQEFGSVSLERKPIDLYAAMRDVYDSRRRAMETDVLKKLAEYLMEVANKREGK